MNIFYAYEATIHYPCCVMDSIVLEQPSSSTACSDNTADGGGGGSRAIDRHNPIIRDEKRLGHGRIFPSTTTTSITDQSHLRNQKPEVGGGDQSSDDELIKASGKFLISPVSSSRCLLSDIAMSSFAPEFHRVPPPPPPSPPLERLHFHHENTFKKKDDDLPSPPPPAAPKLTPSPPPLPSVTTTTKPPSPPHPPPSSNKVVVLEVALHCRGCERKMKKHISKIEGIVAC